MDELSKILALEKLGQELNRIEEEYKSDEDLNPDYVEGLTDGLKVAIQSIKELD